MTSPMSARHGKAEKSTHNNNNTKPNGKLHGLPMIQTMESSEYGKKHKSPLSVTMRRLWTRFNILSKPNRIIVLLLVSIVIGFMARWMFILLMTNMSSSITSHTTNSMADTIISGLPPQTQQQKPQSRSSNTNKYAVNLPQSSNEAAAADLDKMKNRPKISGAAKRVVELMDDDVTKVLDGNESSRSVPEPGKHTLVERYNPMPHEMPALKGASSLDKGQCQAIADWQTSHDPTCNIIHEMTWGWDHIYGDDIENVHKQLTEDDEQARLKAGGAFRHVWMIREYDGTKRALKTLRAVKAKEFDLRNFDRHRRDAVSMGQLTKSPLIVDIYGFCTNSALFDWGEGGDLFSLYLREPHISNEKLLKIAYNVSQSVQDAHNFDSKGRPTIAHTDIKPDQFLYQDGYYRLSDFNRVRFLMWNDQKDLQCGFTVGKNGGVWRSPEEYHYDVENEKVDVYSLGNVLYYLLMKQNPWRDVATKDVYDLVMQGKRPKISKEILESDEIYHKYMIQAIQMAYTHKASERPTAGEIAKKIQEGIDKL